MLAHGFKTVVSLMFFRVSNEYSRLTHMLAYNATSDACEETMIPSSLLRRADGKAFVLRP